MTQLNYGELLENNEVGLGGSPLILLSCWRESPGWPFLALVFPLRSGSGTQRAQYLKSIVGVSMLLSGMVHFLSKLLLMF